MITTENLKKMWMINQQLKSFGVERELTIKEIITPEVLGAVISVPSFIDETKPTYKMHFQQNYLLSDKNYDGMMKEMNDDIFDFLSVVEKKYKSLARIITSFEPLLF